MWRPGPSEWVDPSPGGGGTSESAPLLAGLQADAGQAAGQPLGFLNPALYHLAGSAVVRDITAVDPADPPIQAGLNQYGEFDPGYLITVGEDGPPDAPGVLTATNGSDDATGIGAPSRFRQPPRAVPTDRGDRHAGRLLRLPRAPQDAGDPARQEVPLLTFG